MIVSVSPRIFQIGHGTVPEIVEQEVGNVLLRAQSLDLSVGVIQFLTPSMEDEPLNSGYPIQ